MTTPEQQRRTSQSGADLIAAERRHQVEDRGFTVEHDTAQNSSGILAAAALTFIETALGRREPKAAFPLMDESLSCKPRGLLDPIHDLVKAGGLLAAEIDRLQAIAATDHSDQSQVSTTSPTSSRLTGEPDA